jgi:hypothetical protein
VDLLPVIPLNIIGPIHVVIIGRLPEMGKEVEFEVIVAVYQSWDDKIAVQSDNSIMDSRTQLGSDLRNPAPGDPHVTQNEVAVDKELALLEQNVTSNHCFLS